MFAAYRHHAFITNSTHSMVEADERHRDHALVEQVIAELKNGPPEQLPSGKYAANAAWLACAVTRSTSPCCRCHGVDARRALGDLRTRIINIPARIAATGGA